ncbi:MAG: hypothetical protein ACREQO_23755 [Candidatus Binatia bacterium]
MAMGTSWFSRAIVCATIAAAIAAADHLTLAQDVRTRAEAARFVDLENVRITEGTVSGDVANRSRDTVRDVQLLIRHIWLWDRETKPGSNDPSTASYYALGKDLPPGGRLSFTYKPTTPLSKMAGGHFVTTVAIAGFAQVIQQSK